MQKGAIVDSTTDTLKQI